MNKVEVNWLLQTIYDAEDAELFLLAQFERGRIPLKVMAEVARERGWIKRRADGYFAPATSHSTEYSATEVSNAAA